MRRFLLSALLLLPAGPAFAAPSGELEFFDFERASLEDLLNIKTRVASRMEFSAREAPGIVSIITREEIVNSGARNLIDVLRLVPGLDFGVDVESSLGLGVRGNWGIEGKILVLLDGQRYNEPFFGTAQLERFSAEQVERIEIIRGPGSAVYGGFAGLGVVKITTRSARAMNGSQASLSWGYLARTFGSRSANLSFGKVFENAELSAEARVADFNRSDRRYTDFSGGSYSMADASEIHSRNLNIGLKSRVADLRLIADLHRTTQQDHYDATILPVPLDRNFDAYFAEASRDFTLGEKLTLTPSLNYSYQEPFNGFDAAEYPRDKSSHLSRGMLLAAYTPSELVKFSGGAELSRETAILADTTPPAMYFKNGGKRTVRYRSSAFFMEAVGKHDFGLISAGGRYDKNEKVDAAFSPRLAWTKVFERLHVKAIFSRAFRAPGIDNIDANPDLKPEKTTVLEVETGYKFGEDFFLSVNAFDIRIKEPIVFYVQNSSQAYGNYGRTGTKGFELTARLKKDWGYADFTYSHYAALRNSVAFYNSGAGSRSLLAFAPDKFTLNSSVDLLQDLSINPSAVYYSGRRGYYAAGRIKRFNDVLLANLNFSLKNLSGGRMELGLGVFDLFNSGYGYIQPYDGGHAPLPGPSREIRARLSYKF